MLFGEFVVLMCDELNTTAADSLVEKFTAVINNLNFSGKGYRTMFTTILFPFSRC
jgi:hypothetical protein